MADEIDVANDLIIREMEQRIAAARKDVTLGAAECVDCGEPVPDLRRQLGKSLCFDCAELAERRAKLFARP